jgi:hypothetical protein
MTTTVEIVPGMYDIPAEQYHADPVPGGSLSSTGARKLADCPAKFRYGLDHPQPYKAAFDFGTAAHRVVLGVGPELVLVDEERWDTNETKATVAAIRAAGNIPLKREALQRVHDMATELLTYPQAADLLAPGAGVAEQTLLWQTDGIWCRALLDYLREDGIVDYKSARSAHPDAIEKAVQAYGYHQQDDWYRTGAVELGLIPPTGPFHFVVQETEPPYPVTVVELDLGWQHIARQRNARALWLYESCRTSGYWPPYATDTVLISPPAWLERQYA